MARDFGEVFLAIGDGCRHTPRTAPIISRCKAYPEMEQGIDDHASKGIALCSLEGGRGHFGYVHQHCLVDLTKVSVLRACHFD